MGIWHPYRITYINRIYNTAIVGSLIIVFSTVPRDTAII